MSLRQPIRFGQAEMTLWDKLRNLSWTFILLIAVLSCIGFMTLYSAANGSLKPWAIQQIARFIIGLGVLVGVALIDIRLWMRGSYLLYGITVLLLIAVERHGSIGMGAQRWINLGFIQLQPSEIMKITMILALARYFHGISAQDIGRPVLLIPPLLMVFIPVILVMKQPDLGTAMMLTMASGGLFFLAGVRLWKFALVIVGGIGILPIAWRMMREYQRQRILVFLHPENDPLGSGYHILQSKIALGSGGVFGKGFMLGTQSHLSFLPERQTDFIFTMLAEEWGMMGGLVLLGLYALLIAHGYVLSLRCRNQYGRLVGLGLTTTFFLYAFINIAMVMGLVPVVGVPLPLISYGGTAMLTLLFGFGLIMNVHVHRDVTIGRRMGGED